MVRGYELWHDALDELCTLRSRIKLGMASRVGLHYDDCMHTSMAHQLNRMCREAVMAAMCASVNQVPNWVLFLQPRIFRFIEGPSTASATLVSKAAWCVLANKLSWRDRLTPDLAPDQFNHG